MKERTLRQWKRRCTGMLAALAVVLFAAFSLKAFAAVEDLGTHVRYYGTGTNDNDLLFTTGDVSKYERCWIMSITGTVDLEVSLDGTNFTTAAVSIQDFGATSNDLVLVTVANRLYGVPVGGIRKIRVRQAGATAASASMNCWAMGR